MKIIKCIIHLILLPLLILIYIFCGFYAAILSAMIEFGTFQGFFTSDFLELLPPAFVAGTLVFSLEFSKIFLHFFKARCLAKNMTLPKIISAILHALVILSVVCSIIFTVSTLNRAAYNEEQIIAQTATVESNLNNDITITTAAIQAQYEKDIEPYQKAVDLAQQALSKASIAGMGPKTSTAVLSALQTTLDKANLNFDNAVKRLSTIRDTQIEAKTNELNEKAKIQIQQLRDTSTKKNASRFDNPLLSNFLLVLAETLFQTEVYSRSAYLWFCLLLGVTISILLELLISTSASLLAQNTDFLFDPIDGVSEKIRSFCDEVVLTLFQAFSALTVYLGIMSFYYIDFKKEQIFGALLALSTSFFLTKHFLPKDEKASTSSSEHTIYNQIRDCVLQGVVSFMGYIFLGFIFGQDAVTLDLSTVAIGLGATISGGISIFPKFIRAQAKAAA